ncbi:MAG TPA: CPBP family intramembrane glutamic endopeptidase [Sphingomicrobium sp.]|nr:CPBP family intramembrane glutamic endopeptidase [Sphingomicrobium sp.]
MKLPDESRPSFRLKAIPLLVTVLLAFGVPILAAKAAALCSTVWHTPSPHGPTLPWLYMQHGFQLLLALIVIFIMKRFLDVDFGLHLPRGKTYLWPAIAWGAAFGILMTLVDYAPELLAAAKPKIGYPLTSPNVAGWLFFEGAYVGPTEEIPFRSLLVTYLAATMPGRLRLGRFEMNWAGVFVALIFALLHATNFDVRAWPLALGQQIYAFALGVLYAYWLEKSGSVLAPMVGHNASDVVEYLILFTWVGLL